MPPGKCLYLEAEDKKKKKKNAVLKTKKRECNEPMQIYRCYWERFLKMIATTIATIYLCLITILLFVVLATICIPWVCRHYFVRILHNEYSDKHSQRFCKTMLFYESHKLSMQKLHGMWRYKGPCVVCLLPRTVMLYTCCQSLYSVSQVGFCRLWNWD